MQVLETIKNRKKMIITRKSWASSQDCQVARGKKRGPYCVLKWSSERKGALLTNPPSANTQVLTAFQIFPSTLTRIKLTLHFLSRQLKL
jgi:hypothetical protein